MSEQWPDGGVEMSPADIDALDARWAGAWTPDEVARRLAGISAPWYVAAGWALDLFRGEQTRKHEDIEIAVPAGRFGEIQECFGGFVFDAVGAGRIWDSATPEVLAATHQTWLRDPATGGYLLDVFREPHDGQTWICRRDETIRLPYADIIGRTSGGIPYLLPELVLLFKAKKVRPKDQADFDGILPLMTQSRREALARFLSRVHPGHAWLAALSSPAPACARSTGTKQEAGRSRGAAGRITASNAPSPAVHAESAIHSGDLRHRWDGGRQA